MPGLRFSAYRPSDARVLILGSLPGQVSLQQRQYYAQPHNAFWRIMGALFGAGLELPYAERTRRLLDARVALGTSVARLCVPVASMRPSI